MDKEQVLRNRLSFLESKEIEKVIKKYEDSKLDIDDIVKEVCKEHNINYEQVDNNFDKSVSNISSIISKYIKDIIKIVRKSVYGRNLESTLEIIVKIIIYILFILILKLPFIIFEGITRGINNTLFYPFEEAFNSAENIIYSLIYLLMCVTILIKMFGNSKIPKKKSVSKAIIDSVDKEYKWIDFIIKIIIYSLVLLPLILLVIVSFIFVIITIYLFIKGINLSGLTILFIGLASMLITIINMIKDSLKHKIKSRLFQMVICSIVFISGVFITFYNLNRFETPKNLEKSVVKTISEDINIKLDSLDTKIYIRKGNYELITDETLEEGNIKVEVTYYDDYVDVVYNQQKNNEKNYLIFKTVEDEPVNGKVILKNIYKDLKNGYIFNYSDVKNMSIKIYGNVDTIKSLEDSNK